MCKNREQKWSLSFPTLLMFLSAAMLIFFIISRAEALSEPEQTQYMTISGLANAHGYSIKESKQTVPSGTIADYSYILSKGIVAAGRITFTVRNHEVVSISVSEDIQFKNMLPQDLIIKEDGIYMSADDLNDYFDRLFCKFGCQ